MLRQICRQRNLRVHLSTNLRVASSTVPEPCGVPHPELRKDVKFLGSVLGSIIKADDITTFETVEKMRTLAKDWRHGDEAKLDELVAMSAGLSSAQCHDVARAFTHFLALANAAESHHRIRRVREREIRCQASDNAEAPVLSSVLGSVRHLLAAHESGHKTGGDAAAASGQEIFDALCTNRVEIVLTAHPTEVNRSTVIRKHRLIDKALATLDRPDLLWHERKGLKETIKESVQSLWWTDEIRRTKPTPLKEARHGLHIVESSLWSAVPRFLRRIDHELMATPQIGKPLPPDVAPVTFASWMGGDRDGNPNVTAQTTKEVAIVSRLRAAKLVRAALLDLVHYVTVDGRKASPALLAALPALGAPSSTSSSSSSSSSSGAAPSTRRPYAELFQHLVHRLDATTAMLEAGHLSLPAPVPGAPEEGEARALQASLPRLLPSLLDPGAPQPLVEAAELVDLLLLAHDSLCANGLEAVADGPLRDLIRQVKCFGLCLLPLDVRQESVRHSEALDAITRFLGLGSYLQWDEETRIAWLLKELNEKRPLLPRTKGSNYAALGSMFSGPVCDVLETTDMIARMPADGLGAYVISMAKSASDVLAVRLLQREAGVAKPMRVVPLFETLDDLNNATGVMEKLWTLPWYRGDIDAKQEVMLGYSDSAKDAGRLAAAWAQYKTQEELVGAAARHGIELSLFHGKGGTASRGGDPSTFRAICAQPPGTVQGRFRITEQGEIITQNYAHPPVAERHLSIYTAALLYEKFLPTAPRSPTPEYRALLDRLSETSCDGYRHVVRGEPNFIPYFRSATPELEIAALNVGSRPAKRRPTGGVETLRAIPWVFAWTQTRLNLTAWLGMGKALAGLPPPDKATLKDMYEKWPWFHAFVDVVDMVMAKTEPAIATNYDAQLVATLPREDTAELLALGGRLREELGDTKRELLSLRGYTEPQEENDILLRGLHVRNPYVDPLNVIQAEVLKRLRSGKDAGMDADEAALLEDALAITINGIANGQKNTG